MNAPATLMTSLLALSLLAGCGGSKSPTTEGAPTATGSGTAGSNSGSGSGSGTSNNFSGTSGSNPLTNGGGGTGTGGTGTGGTATGGTGTGGTGTGGTGTGGSGTGGNTSPPPDSRLTLAQFNALNQDIIFNSGASGTLTYVAPMSGAATYFGDIRFDLTSDVIALGQVNLRADFGARDVDGSASGFVWMGADDVPADVVGIIDFNLNLSQATRNGRWLVSGPYNGSMFGVLDGRNQSVTLQGWTTGDLTTQTVTPIPTTLKADLTGTASGSFSSSINGSIVSER